MIYSYVPADKQVITQPRAARRRGDDGGAVPRRQGQPRARLQRQLRRSRRAEARSRCGSNPRQKQRDYDWLMLGVDRDDAADSLADRGRSAGRPLDVRVHATIARTPASPTTCSPSRSRGGPMSSMLDRAADMRAARSSLRRAHDRCWPRAARPPPGCSSGRQAELAQDYDRAVVEYTNVGARRSRPTATRARRSSASSCAPRRNTPSAAAGSPAWNATKRRSSSTSSRPS